MPSRGRSPAPNLLDLTSMPADGRLYLIVLAVLEEIRQNLK